MFFSARECVEAGEDVAPLAQTFNVSLSVPTADFFDTLDVVGAARRVEHKRLQGGSAVDDDGIEVVIFVEQRTDRLDDFLGGVGRRERGDVERVGAFFPLAGDDDGGIEPGFGQCPGFVEVATASETRLADFLHPEDDHSRGSRLLSFGQAFERNHGVFSLLFS